MLIFISPIRLVLQKLVCILHKPRIRVVEKKIPLLQQKYIYDTKIGYVSLSVYLSQDLIKANIRRDGLYWVGKYD